MRTTEQIQADLWAVRDWPLVRVDDVWRAAMARLANDVPGLLEGRGALRMTGVRACKIHTESFRTVEADRDRLAGQLAAIERMPHEDWCCGSGCQNPHHAVGCSGCDCYKADIAAALAAAATDSSRSTAAAPQPRGTAPTAPGGAAGATNPTNQETQR